MSCDTTFPIRRDYTFRRGEYFTSAQFRLLSEDGESFWDNAVVESQLRASAGGALIYTFVNGAAVTDEDGVGVLSFSLPIPADESEDITPGKYIADVFVTSDSLARKCVLLCRIEVLPTGTRIV